jgi:hypothetical protein
VKQCGFNYSCRRTVYGPTREADRELETQANLLALDGRWHLAAAAELPSFRIVQQLKQQHSLIGYPVASAVEAISIAECEEILSHSKPDAAVCALFRTAISNPGNQVNLKYGVQSSACELLTEFNSLPPDTTTHPLSSADKSLYDKMVDLYEARALHLYVSGYKAVDESRAQRRVD